RCSAASTPGWKRACKWRTTPPPRDRFWARSRMTAARARGAAQAQGDIVSKQVIHSKHAPAAIGPYSQAIRVGDTVYMSGQIGLDPASGRLVEGLDAQAHQVFKNMRAVAQAAGGELDDIVKTTLLLTDLEHFTKVNEIM